MRAAEYPRGSASASPFETPRFAGLLRVRFIFGCAARALRMLAFHSGYSHECTAAKIIFDFYPSRNILSTSRTDTERVAMVSRRGTGRGGPQTLTALGVF